MANFTTKAIKDAFFSLLSKKPIDQITIKDITSLCGISRNTFYYHYEDITALVEEMMTGMVDELIEKYPTVDSLEEGISVAVKFVLENKTAVMHIYNSNQRPIYERSLMRLCRHMSERLIHKSIPQDKISEEDRELMINYYKCTSFGFIMDWCASGLKPGYAESFMNLLTARKNMFAVLDTYLQ